MSKRKKKKKTISHVQLVSAVVVIVIIAIVLFCTFNKLFYKSKNDYYKELLTSIKDSGKDFFNDNKKYIPKEIFESQKVTIGTLKANKYIDEVNDYNKNSCSDDSYVNIIKTGDNNYVYKTCLVCKDEYNNMNDKYCDSSWADSSTISYGISREPLIYISKGSSIDNKMNINLSLVKRDYSGNILAVSSIKTDKSISPKNAKAVDVNKIGEYIIEYEYDGFITQGKVIVYENPAPIVSIGYENIVANGYDSTKKETGFLKSLSWAQKIIITFNKGDNYLTNVGKVLEYQWNKDGKWETVCKGDPCVVEITTEMDQKVKFRSIDEHNNYSKETSEYLIRIDNTKPSCEINLDGSIGNSDWYTKDVKISVIPNSDTSGIKYKSLNIKNDKFDRNNRDVVIHKDDSSSITYIGYVEDSAGNFAFCNKTFKKDSTKPSCTNSGDSVKWTNKKRTIQYGCEDALSGCDKDFSGGESEFVNTMKTTIIPSYVIRDNAGNVTECSERVANIYIDKVEPVCTITGENTTWTNKNVTINYGCSDNESGCDNSGGSITFNKTTKTSTVPNYQIKDNAGNVVNCSNREVSIYVDKTKPSCTINKTLIGNESGVSIEVICSDNESGCTKGSIKEDNLKENKTYTVKDSVGNQNTCTIQVEKQVLRSDAICSKYKTCENAVCGMMEYDCSDCKTGKNTCTKGYDYGKWGTCTLTRAECKEKENTECEICNNGYYHARDKILNECKTGENTCKYGCSTKPKECSTKECGCEEYGSFGEYYQVSSCSSSDIVKCKTVYK